MRSRLLLPIVILLAASLGIVPAAMAEQSTGKSLITVAGQQVEEIMPGMLQGYLTEEEQLDS